MSVWMESLRSLIQPGLAGPGLETLATLGAQACCLVVVGAVAARLARTAGRRHLVWASVLLALAAMPFWGAGGGMVSVPIPLTGGGLELRQGAEATRPESPSPATAARRAGAAQGLDRAAEDVMAKPLVDAEGASRLPSPAVGSGPNDREQGAVSGRMDRLLRALPLIWRLGALIVGAGLVLDLWRRRRLLAGCRRALELESRSTVGAMLDGAGTRGRPRLFQTAALEVPVTWGFFRPVVVLPARSAEWSLATLRHVLLHELAHARRGDASMAALARLVGAAYWPLPPVWWTLRRLAAEAELACDDQVLAAGGRPSSYAAELLSFARSLRGGLPAPVASMARRSGLGARVAAILDPGRDRSLPGPVAVAATLLAGGLLVAPLLGMVRFEPRVVALSSRTEWALAREGAAAGQQPVTAMATAAGHVSRHTSHTTDGDGPDLLPGCGPLESSQVSQNDDRLRIDLRSRDCRLQIFADGKFELAEDERSIARLERNASFMMEERRGGERRRLELQAGTGGTPTAKFSVDGKSREIDDATRAWFAERLPLFLRASGWDAEGRVRRLLARGGAQAVFAEIEQIPGDYVARLYFTALLDQGRLGPADLRRWVALAGESLESDYELAETLSRLPASALADAGLQRELVKSAGTIDSDYELRRTLARLLDRGGLEAGVLDAILEAARSLDSDYETAELLLAVASAYPGPGPVPAVFFEVAGSIESDHEARRVLDAFLRRSDLGASREQLDRILELAQRLDSDYEAAELLTALARRYPAGSELPPSFFVAARAIDSDYELRRTLAAAADRKLGPEALTSLLATAADGIDSDYELAELLLQVRRAHRLDGRAREQFDRAAGKLSGYQRTRVLEALAE